MTKLVELSIDTPEDRSGAAQALAAAEAFEVTTNATYEAAGAALLSVKSRWRQVDEERQKLVAPINEAHKRVQDLFRGPLDFLAAAERVLKGKLAAYQDEQDRLRREAQRQADDLARRERERLQREAAAAEQAAQKKADAQRKAAAEAEAAGRADEARKLQAAADSTEQKAAAKAELLTAAAEQVVAPVVEREAPKVAGLSSRENWLYEITDESLLPREYTQPNHERLRQVVKAMKADTRIAGVRVYRETGIAGRTR